MKTLSVLSLIATWLSLTDAVNLARRPSEPAVIQFDLQRTRLLDPRLRRRQSSTVEAILDNAVSVYLANCSIGSPAQPFRLQLDTGSSDLWVPSSSPTCAQSSCSEWGLYEANSSNTYRLLNATFGITYSDLSTASGNYATDILSIGGVTLEDFQFGVAYNASSPAGILGIGYPRNEALYSTLFTTYPNLPQALVNAGDIHSSAYSLWLNNPYVSTGSILFGGIDTEKYLGTLSTLPIVPEASTRTRKIYRELIIVLTGLGIGGAAGSISASLRIPVVLDSGTTLNYLPDVYTNMIYNQLNITYNSSLQVPIVDCNLLYSNSSIDFTFFEPTISVPMSQLVLAAPDLGEGVCAFGVLPISISSDRNNTTGVLGDAFLTSAYVVYDLTNNEISIAPAKFNCNTSNILEITNGTSGVPGATRVAEAYNTTTATTSTSLRTGNMTTPSGGTTATTTATTTPLGYPCNRDNCLRAFIRDGRYPNPSFCNSLTQAPAVPATTGTTMLFPSYASYCGSGNAQASRVSSACSCLYPAIPAVSATS